MNALPPEEPPSDLPSLQEAYKTLKAEQRHLHAAYQALENRLKTLENARQEKRATFRSKKTSAQTPGPPLLKKHGGWEHLLGIQGFAWLGVFAFLSGVGLFIRYAYTEGWLGPWAVLVSGLLLSVTLLLSGLWVADHHQKYRSWAHALMGAGVALVYFLAYASYHFAYFQAVTHLNAFMDALLLMGIVAVAIALSLWRQSQSLASRAFVLGFFTSVLSTSFYELTLFYNLFLSLGLVFVVHRTRWQLLLRMGVVGSWVLHGIWCYSNPQLNWGTHSLLVVYVLIYSITSLSISPVTLPERPLPHENLTGILNTLGYLSVFIYLSYLNAPYLWAIHTLYTGLMLGLLFITQKKQPLHLFYHGLVGASLPVGFYFCLLEYNAFTQGWFFAVLALGLYAMARLVQPHGHNPPLLYKSYDSLSAACLLNSVYFFEHTPFTAYVLIVLSGFYLSHAPKRHHFWNLAWVFHFNALLVLCIRHYKNIYPFQDGLLSALLFVGFFWQRKAMNASLKHLWLWPGTLAGLIYTQSVLPEASLSSCWALLGAVFVISGFWQSESVVRYQGFAFLACAGLKLLLSDLQHLSMGLRIISLMAIGSILMALAWVYIRYEEQLKERL